MPADERVGRCSRKFRHRPVAQQDPVVRAEHADGVLDGVERVLPGLQGGPQRVFRLPALPGLVFQVAVQLRELGVLPFQLMTGPDRIELLRERPDRMALRRAGVDLAPLLVQHVRCRAYPQ